MPARRGSPGGPPLRVATVPFNLRPPFGRRWSQQEVRDVTELVAALRNRLAAKPDGSSGETLRGQIAGAESDDRVTLPWDPESGSRKFQAGFLAGHLFAHLIRTLGSLPGTLLVPAAAYAASLVSPQAERYLVEAPPQAECWHRERLSEGVGKALLPRTAAISTEDGHFGFIALGEEVRVLVT